MAFGGVFIDWAAILAVYLFHNALHFEIVAYVQRLDV